MKHNTIVKKFKDVWKWLTHTDKYPHVSLMQKRWEELPEVKKAHLEGRGRDVDYWKWGFPLGLDEQEKPFSHKK